MSDEVAPIGKDLYEARGEQRGDYADHAQVPHLLGIKFQAAGRLPRDKKRSEDADGRQHSRGGNGEGAKLNEARVHDVRVQIRKPTRGAVGRYSGEPVLRRWGSPRLFRHSELADAAHRADLS